jgi:hypothetical protein
MKESKRSNRESNRRRNRNNINESEEEESCAENERKRRGSWRKSGGSGVAAHKCLAALALSAAINGSH